MNNLLKAAQSVLNDWEACQNIHYGTINDLRSAVGRAQESPRFEDWFWREQEAETFVNTARYGFDGGVRAERERIKHIIREITEGGCGNCDRLMEKIDE